MKPQSFLLSEPLTFLNDALGILPIVSQFSGDQLAAKKYLDLSRIPASVNGSAKGLKGPLERTSRSEFLVIEGEDLLNVYLHTFTVLGGNSRHSSRR